MEKKLSTRQLVYIGLIAALYVVLIAIFPAISFGQLQVRIAEMLTLLPVLTPLAIPGITLGCLIANLIFSGVFLDILLGTLATLIAGVLTYLFRKNLWIAAFPPVIINAFMVAYILMVSVGANFLLSVFYVGVGQLIACYALGVPFVTLLKKVLPDQFWK